MEQAAALITDPFGLTMMFLLVPAVVFYASKQKAFASIFKFLPPLVFIYFIPTFLSTFNIVPTDSPIYGQMKLFIIPPTLVLLTMTVDLKAMLKLGPKALMMFAAGTIGVFAGGIVSFLLFKDQLPPDIWKGMAALCGSWVGGTANFIAIGSGLGTPETMLGMMVIVDVLIASIWAGVLFYFADRYENIDAKMGADNTAIHELKDKIVKFQKENERIPQVADYAIILAIAFVVGWVSLILGRQMPVTDVLSATVWMVIFTTTIGLALSFTPLRKLDGAGASKLGGFFIYVLICVIGAGANLKGLVEYPTLIAMGAVWMLVHVIIITLAMFALRAPLFFMAVGSEANIGGTASCPIMASAFHPSLASVGVLLALCGTVSGNYVGLLLGSVLKSWS